MKRITRKAWNRGTAVHLGGARVRFVWPCDCTKVETVKSPAGPMSHEAVATLVRNWRLNGVTMDQCKKHPNWSSPKCQVARLNAAHPQK